MAEQIQETQETQMSHNDAVDAIVGKMRRDEFKVHFYCPAMPNPSGGVGVLLRLASHLSEKYDVNIWYEPQHNPQISQQETNKAKKRVDIFNTFYPSWVDFDISKLNFIPLGDKPMNIIGEGGKIEEIQTQSLMVGVEDIMFIPEGFPNLMQITSQVACKRVVLAQSWAYVLTGMQDGQNWQQFGVHDVVSVSDAITEFINSTMPGLKIKKLNQAIDREVFKLPKHISEKAPAIAFMSPRGPETQLKITNMIKMFRAVNPHYRWVRFVELGGLDRETFGERLSEFAFCLYTDEIAGFGTLPLEAMACGTHVIGWFPFGSKEYVRENNGFWAQNGEIFQMVELIGAALDRWLGGEMDIDVIQKDYEATLANYTMEGEKNRIFEIVNEYKNERCHELESTKTN